MADTLNSKEVAEVRLRMKKAEAYIKPWIANVTRWRQLYDMEHYPKNKPRQNETQYVDPVYTNTTDLAVGIMLANEVSWISYAFSPSHKEQQDTGKIEKLVEGILEVNNEREEKFILYELFRNFVRDGAGILYSIFDPDIAKASLNLATVVDEEAEGGVSQKWLFSDIPIRVKPIDPVNFIGLPGGPKRWLMMGCKYKMSVLDVEILYNITLDRYKGRTEEAKSTIQGEFMDVWDYVQVDKVDDATGTVVGKKLAVRNTCFFDKDVIVAPHIMEGYIDLPYTIQFFRPAGDMPRDWSSIMSPMESSVQLLEKGVNRRAHQIDVFTGMPLIAKTQPGRAVQVDPGLFGTVQIGTDEAIEFPKWPGDAPDVQLHLTFLGNRVQQSGFSDMMFGGSVGRIAGYALSQMYDQDRIRLNQPIKHLELLLTLWAKKVMNLLEVFAAGSTIAIYGRYRGQREQDNIEVDDIPGYALKAQIRPNFPADQSRKVAMATQVKGIVSNYHIMHEYLDIEQPEDEEERKLIEAATFHPIAMQYALIAEMKTRAEQGDDIAKMTLQSLIQNGLPGQPGRPGEGPNPAGMAGMPSSTGAPTSQEQGGKPAGQSLMEAQQHESQQRPGFSQGQTRGL
jgi:hypothetical protein